MADRIVRIAGGSGYWGDTPTAPFELVSEGGIDYLILDYLAEVTMSILAKAKERDSGAGYATDFVTLVMKPLIGKIAEKGIKVVANAGGVNVDACRQALERVVREAGVDLRIGTVEGDDLMPSLDRVRETGVREMSNGAALPDRIMSANAYLGAFPIAAALDAGADIVVTGRCVDSALVLGPLIHEFGWKPDEHDRLAGGSLCGHILECGAQATGGNFTDWREVVGDWSRMGFPIAEVQRDGSFVLTKPTRSGGLVSPLTASEQMLYEIGDPAAYLLPDVSCDFRGVTMTQEGKDRVRIEGARGRAPGSRYKVSATWSDGYACTGTFVVVGEEAPERARRQGEAMLAKVRETLRRFGLGDFTATALDVVGAESLFGPHAHAEAARCREVILRLAIQHADRRGAELFSKEFVGAALSMSPGLTGLAPGRPKPTPTVRLFSFLLDKRAVDIVVRVSGEAVALRAPAAIGPDERAQRAPNAPAPSAGSAPPDPAEGENGVVPLRVLAVARSGDKGDSANIGVIARRAEDFARVKAALTPEAVAAWFSHLVRGPVERFELPGVYALNFVLHEALGGGGAASIRLDPQGKTYAQQLLDMPVGPLA